MKIVAALLVVSLGFLALAEADSSLERCPRVCTREYSPVCAEWRRGRVRPIVSRCTFSTKCVLGNQICKTNRNWITVDERRKCRNETPDCDELRKASQ
ncbi:turripeptide Gsg9.2 [Drosophila teissieri]|uniref:turripeptide Gsg9.2 n=1 Tax=Drosophila teissieri TaxID=7243 RepID=UPI001CBA157D|nr:turripeptide Gsg9.2 [Drosophila teissieri]